MLPNIHGGKESTFINFLKIFKTQYRKSGNYTECVQSCALFWNCNTRPFFSKLGNEMLPNIHGGQESTFFNFIKIFKTQYRKSGNYTECVQSCALFWNCNTRPSFSKWENEMLPNIHGGQKSTFFLIFYKYL